MFEYFSKKKKLLRKFKFH